MPLYGHRVDFSLGTTEVEDFDPAVLNDLLDAAAAQLSLETGVTAVRNGSAIDVNAGGRPRLAQTVSRESKVKPNGETVVTTATQSRSIADPSQMGPREVVQEVSRPTEGGEAVETTVYERGVNGRMLPTQVTIEQVQN